MDLAVTSPKLRKDDMSWLDPNTIFKMGVPSGIAIMLVVNLILNEKDRRLQDREQIRVMTTMTQTIAEFSKDHNAIRELAERQLRVEIINCQNMTQGAENKARCLQ